MRATFLFTLIAALAAVLIQVQDCRADFVLTDKNDANGVTIPTGATASSTYVMETKDNAFGPSVPGSVAGFRFNDNDGSNTLLTAPNGGADLRQGVTQNLAGNEENGYVGTVVGKAWGNAVTLSFDGAYLTNGPGADLYVTAKNVNGSGAAQSTSTQDKSFAVGFRIVSGPNAGWHLYNYAALPSNFQPAEGAGNVLGAIDLSNLKISAGNFLDADLAGIGTTMALGTNIDRVILVNNNAANAHAFGFLGTTAEAPTSFVARRDFDNADLDGDAFTGVDYLTGRYGTRYFNGQDGPQAWFVGLLNTSSVVVPEPGAFLFGGLVCGVIGLGVGGRRLVAKLCDRG